MPINRSGFTLIELLVAIVLVAIGVLAAVASSAVIVREEDQGKSAAIAASVAANRLEWLRSHPCRPESGYTTGVKGISESWVSMPSASSVRDLSDSVSFAVAGTKHVFVLHARAWC